LRKAAKTLFRIQHDVYDQHVYIPTYMVMSVVVWVTVVNL